MFIFSLRLEALTPEKELHLFWHTQCFRGGHVKVINISASSSRNLLDHPVSSAGSGHNPSSSPLDLLLTFRKVEVDSWLEHEAVLVAGNETLRGKPPSMSFLLHYLVRERGWWASKAAGCAQRRRTVEGIQERRWIRGSEDVMGVQLIVLTTQFRAVCRHCHCQHGG